MADEREVTIVIKGKNLTPEAFQAARKELAGVADETEKVRQRTKPATDQTNLFSGAWKNLVGAFALGNIIADVVGNLASEVMGFVKNAQSITAVRASFEGLARSVGSSAAEMLAAMRTASRGVVSDFDLMLVANKAILLGLPVTASEMGRLTSAAITLGKAMGLDARQSVDNLVTALSRSSPQILDNLGLKVDLEAATLAYATSLGKSVDALTDAERSEAFYYGALKAADEALLSLNSTTSEQATLTEKLGRVWTTTGNFITDVFADLNESVGRGTSSFGGFYDMVMSAIPGNAGYAASLKLIQQDADKAGQAQRDTAAATAKQKAEAAAAVPVYRDWSKELKDAETKVQALSSSRLKEIETAKKAGASQKDLTAQFGLGAVALKLVDERLKEEEAAHKKATTEREKSTAAVKKNEEAFAKLARQQAQTQEAERLIFLTKAMADAHVEMAKKAEETATAERKLAADRAAVTNKAFAESLDAAVQYGEQYLALITTQHEQELRAVETQRAAALKAIEPLRTQVPAEYEASRQQIMAIYDRMLADLEVHGQKQLGQWARIAAGIPSALIAGLASGNPAASLSKYLGDSLFGDEGPLTQTFFRGLEKIGTNMPSWLYQGLANAIPGLGALAGPLIEKGLSFIGDAFKNVFGGNDTKKAREEFAKSMDMTLDQVYRKLQSLGAEGNRLSNQALNVIGKNDEAANRAWMAEVTTFFAKHEEQQRAVAREAEAAAAAQVAAQDAVTSKIRANIDALNDQRNTLQASIQEELDNPEYENGVRVYDEEEKRVMAQMAALDKQREAAEAQLKNAEGKILDSAQVVREGMEKIFREPFRAGFVFDMPPQPGGWTGGSWPSELRSEGFASGGMAHGPLNAYIEPGRKEIIGDISFMQDALVGALSRMGGAGAVSASGSGGGPQVIHNHIYLDGLEIDERIVQVGQGALQGGRWQVPQDNISRRAR